MWGCIMHAQNLGTKEVARGIHAMWSFQYGEDLGGWLDGH